MYNHRKSIWLCVSAHKHLYRRMSSVGSCTVIPSIITILLICRVYSKKHKKQLGETRQLTTRGLDYNTGAYFWHVLDTVYYWISQKCRVLLHSRMYMCTVKETVSHSASCFGCAQEPWAILILSSRHRAWGTRMPSHPDEVFTTPPSGIVLIFINFHCAFG